MPAAKNQSLFEEPPHTLVKALKYALDNPALTQADLRFAFRTSPELILSAHRPLICARTTKAFRARYMPALENIDQEHDYENPLIITLDPDHVQPDLFRDILHYWYTGVFERATNVLATTFGVEATGRDGIGVKDGPQHANIIDPSSADASARLAEDMFNLWKEGTYSDVELTLPPLSRPSSQVEQPLLPPGPYHAHRFLLSSHSSYFSAMLSVSLAESTTLALHSDIFPPVTLTSFLHFAYTGHLPPIPETSTLKQRLNHFELLHLAGDFLGMGDSLCVHTAYHLAALAHNLTTCRCDQCQQVLPPLLIIAHRHLRTGTSSLLDACGRVLSDPVGMHLTWPHRPIAELSPPALRDTIASCTITRIVPANAIDSLQSIHALSMALEAHAAESWSHTITTTMLKPILTHTTGLIVAGFPTITSSSPTFLACVDGMGLSLDFLDFLLVHVVKQLGDATVGKVYQAVVRDLLGRGSVADNFAEEVGGDEGRQGFGRDRRGNRADVSGW
ncbi:hypothetical protein BC938DRAFT_479700 [Jimgerdemannia flammicorona]|uniref:BTB domain-containing protein n=1 Tax=Jimgerdemannia flammicorona TaxID=994334 RepID=A0A433QKE2_9FUNG|nr:hypothetical protein BC938DRAFT_479700 [Jimgerdemannia flammicorona]